MNTVYEEDNPNRLVVGLGIGNAGTYCTYIRYSYIELKNNTKQNTPSITHSFTFFYSPFWLRIY